MVDAAPRVDHANHVNKAVAKVLMATRGILAVAMLAGMAGLGGSASFAQPTQIIEGYGDGVSCWTTHITGGNETTCNNQACFNTGGGAQIDATITNLVIASDGSRSCDQTVCTGCSE